MGRGLSDYEIGIIKALIKLKISNQKILGCINHRRGNVGNHINSGRITDIKNRKIGADISPASEKEAKEFIEQYGNPIQKEDKGLDEILRVDENNPDFLVTQEGDRVEFKKSFPRYKDEKLLKFVQGVANKKGGYILFGINEDKQHQGEIIGLEEKDIKDFRCDKKRITEQFNARFSQEIKFEQHQKEINNKTICILQIFESNNKPVIDKNRDIYYRYSGATEKIQKQDLQEILKEQMAKDTMLMLSRHIEQILKNGIENSAILNVATGDVEGKSGSFVIDESLLPQIAFIKEGEFVETKGAPALVLKGEVEATTILKTEQKVNIGDSRVYECFFKSEELAPDEAKEYLDEIAGSPIELFPIRFFAQKAGMNKEEVIEYLKKYKDERKIKKKIEKLEKNQPERLKIASTIECEKLKKEDLLSLANRGGEIGKWLESIESYDEQTIRNEKEFLLRFIQKLYEHCEYCKKEDPLLLSKVRKTIVYLDKVLYPLD